MASAASAGAPLPRYVQDELHAYLRCGVLTCGFARVRCAGCGRHKLVAISCKRCGVCPSCGGRQMSETAAELVTRVVPEVPVRQWVLSLPWALRLPGGLTVADLGWVLAEHGRQFPGLRAAGRMSVYLDEAQTVPGWEGLVRRLMDEGGVELFVSGSSAKLLSREVATSLRGRAMEVLVHPFSFREALRHAGAEPAGPLDRLKPADRAALDQRLRRYLAEGGFPEAQGAEPRDRAALLSGYVDVLVLRDVIERHAVSNPLALRFLERQLLANPGGSFSVKKHYDTLRSQGVPVGKDTLHHYLAHLEDAFLVRTVAMHSASERQRMVNLRKAYPVDPGLIALFERSGRTHHGRALETAMLLELERRGYEVAYVRTREGFEVDFLAQRAGEAPLLVQACLESEGDQTWQRELRALEAAATAHPDARPFLVTLDAAPPRRPLPGGLTWAPAARWLLEEL